MAKKTIRAKLTSVIQSPDYGVFRNTSTYQDYEADFIKTLPAKFYILEEGEELDEAKEEKAEEVPEDTEPTEVPEDTEKPEELPKPKKVRKPPAKKTKK